MRKEVILTDYTCIGYIGKIAEKYNDRKVTTIQLPHIYEHVQ